ncbi:hypothetical protein P0Y31_12180 [Knoellia sp. 3-2P3]|uniref:glycosyltransferase 87 family protein n=1 Tax=unclassified Knoellia TaxID=2618719 RepID=UPI0023D97AC1|nr:glycosyltransferase 87 family protein [Knoellia sp. 3-2P3]MDF2093102.1 hypothetical protein [Knoellia sp. 3-2P3]
MTPSFRRVTSGAAKVLGATFLLTATVYALHPFSLGWDSHPYWLTGHGVYYTNGPMTTDAYLYSPAFAQIIRPMTALPWPVFASLWSLLLAAGLAWLLAPLRYWAIPLWLAGLPEIVAGNVFIPLALAMVLGTRRPWLWALAALTKVTIFLGPIWFAARREWRSLWLCLSVTVGVACLSALWEPHLWTQWWSLLYTNAHRSGETLGASVLPPLVYRLPAALALVLWGARTHRTWALPIGMVLASPVMWLGTLTLLAATPRLLAQASPTTALPSGRAIRVEALAPDTDGGRVARS